MNETTKSLLQKAIACRSAGRFAEAYEAFMAVAEETDSILGKAETLLEATTNLTMLDDFHAANNQLSKIRNLLSGVDVASLGPPD